MKVEWDNSLKIGIEKIDKQHKEIFNQTNRFLVKLEKLKNSNDKGEKLKNEIEDLFYFLTDYVITHFNDEEELQQEYNYIYYKQHRKEHEIFKKKIKDLKYKYLIEGEEVNQLISQVEEELLGWLIAHIGNKDKEIVNHVK